MKYHTKLLLTLLGGGASLTICAVSGGLALFGSAIFEGLLSRSAFSLGAAAPNPLHAQRLHNPLPIAE